VQRSVATVHFSLNSDGASHSSHHVQSVCICNATAAGAALCCRPDSKTTSAMHQHACMTDRSLMDEDHGTTTGSDWRKPRNSQGWQLLRDRHAFRAIIQGEPHGDTRRMFGRGFTRDGVNPTQIFGWSEPISYLVQEVRFNLILCLVLQRSGLNH
jgi:hypothetical protein